jgi:hypothetical protein
MHTRTHNSTPTRSQRKQHLSYILYRLYVHSYRHPPPTPPTTTTTTTTAKYRVQPLPFPLPPAIDPVPPAMCRRKLMRLANQDAESRPSWVGSTLGPGDSTAAKPPPNYHSPTAVRTRTRPKPPPKATDGTGTGGGGPKDSTLIDAVQVPQLAQAST